MGRASATIRKYGLALLLGVACAIYQVPAVKAEQGSAGALAILAVASAAWWGGTGPGLVVSALLVLITLPADLAEFRPIRHTLYGVAAASISLLVGSLHDARRRAGEDAERRRAGERLVDALNADLRRRVGELEAILDVLPVGVAIAEDPECHAIRVNGYFAPLLGLEPGANASLNAPEGQGPRSFRLERDGREMGPSELPLQRAAREGESTRDLEMEAVHANGRVVSLLGSAAPLRDVDGKIRGSVGAFLDMTELKRAREELVRAKEAAEAASRAKDLFLAMISHELRTPLAPARLVVSGLLADPRTPAGVRSELEVVQQALEAEVRLVDDLLDATRAGADKLQLIVQRTDAHAVIRRALEACRGDIASAGVELVAELRGPGPAVVGDPVRLQQVIWNLVKNACKFTPRGGQIRVRARSSPAEGGRLLVEVEDTGAGMGPELLERVFRPFEQGGEGLRRPGGLGLGLTIARAVAEAHGGRLRASSPGEGRGSTFTLELPLAGAPGERPARRKPAAGPPAALPRRLLVVEDDPALARMLARALRREGAEVVVASGLAEARAAARQGEFDLLLTDLHLPDGDGLELAGLLGDRAPAIALSGSATAAETRRCLAAGFSAHLVKPVDLDTLFEAIREAAGTGEFAVVGAS